MSLETTLKRLKIENENSFPAYAWPGGYPLFYITADMGIICPTCANKEEQCLTDDKTDSQWYLIAVETNWEDNDLQCDNCYKQIESAYGDSEETA